jgi:hypothetical protein
MSENTLNEFSKIYLQALNDNSSNVLIKNGINYEKYFMDVSNNLEQLYTFFNNGIKFDDGSEIKLTLNDIVGFYLNYRDALSEKDLIFFKSISQSSPDIMNNELISAKEKIKKLIKNTRQLASTIKLYLSELDRYPPVQYNINQNNKIKCFKLFISSNHKEVEEDDALIIFNSMNTSKRYPVIIYSNSIKKYIYKFSNKYPVNFDKELILRLTLPYNSITILNEIGEIVTFDFVNKKCYIENNPKNKNDDRVKKVLLFMSILTLEEVKTFEKIEGEITFVVNKPIIPYNLYEFFMLDKIASILFFIDEKTNAWCSKDNFYVFFRDFSSEMLINNEENISNVKIAENYLRFKMQSKKSDNLIGFTINFNTKSEKILQSFIYKFSRLLTFFINDDFRNQSRSIPSTPSNSINFSNLIYKKPIEALNAKAGKFFKPETKLRSESGKSLTGKYYSKNCCSARQPIIIEKDEIEEWIKYGKSPVSFPPKEWGFDEEFWIVCPGDNYSNVNFIINEQDSSGIIRYLPCCGTQKEKKIEETEIRIKPITRKGTTELRNLVKMVGTLNSSLSSFLSECYSADNSYVFSKYGTTFEEVDFIYLNSAIVALLISTGKGNVNFESRDSIEENIRIVKDEMTKLPLEIYKQELYDMSNNEIVKSIKNEKTFLDPYLYYRGLEILFNVQIFVFTSDKGRMNPISDIEDYLKISTLEIPRCKNVHIRFNNQKDIVCLYKNYGTKDRLKSFPACELIINSSVKDGKIYNMKVNWHNMKFFDSLFNLLSNYVYPLEWESIKDSRIRDNCFNNPYDTNWLKFNNLGNIIGQEIDINGKVTCLIFEEWNIEIPPSQPLYIINSVKSRKPLKTIEEACKKFEYSSIDEDGIWINFNGKDKGLKILCIKKENYETEEKEEKEEKTFNTALELINKKNKTSIFMQIISWLWKTHSTKLPIFSEWWMEHSQIDNDLIFKLLPDTKINCHNIMFPRLSTFNEKITAMSKIWPFFFYRNKIHVNKALSDAILNFFNVEYSYLMNLKEDDVYVESDYFITGLIPTDNDFKRGDDIILINPEHISDWISSNNNFVSKYKSLHNMNIIKHTIDINYRKLEEPYPFMDRNGKIYLIQNTIQKSHIHNENALQIANYWKIYERNPGFNFIPTEIIENPNYIEYRIGLNDFLEVYNKDNYILDSDDYLSILCYDNGESYAAMLPIL